MNLGQLAPSVYEHNGDDRIKTTCAGTLTVLLGAGSSIYADAPSTGELTELITKRSLSRDIYDRLVRVDPDSNFEDVLHVVEEIESLQDPDLGVRALNCLQPFVRVVDDVSSLANINDLRQERFAIIDAIATRFDRLDYDRHWRTLYRLLRPLFERYRLDVFTLNYELLADVAVFALSVRTAKPWFSGFESVADDPERGAQFLSGMYAHNDFPMNLRVGHLHGSVCYGYSHRYATDEGVRRFEIAEFADPAEARRNWARYRGFALRSEAGRLAAAPIISGLRKSEKLNAKPYGNYFHGFAEAVSTNPRLLVVGYGGWDPRVNFWLNEFREIHGARGRLVDVTAETQPERFLLQKTVGLGLEWREVAPNLFRNGEAVFPLVFNGGLHENAAIPCDELVRHFETAEA